MMTRRHKAEITEDTEKDKKQATRLLVFLSVSLFAIW